MRVVLYDAKTLNAIIFETENIKQILFKSKQRTVSISDYYHNQFSQLPFLYEWYARRKFGLNFANTEDFHMNG